ncbi:hypothetical protein [Kaistella rhinocerotis]|uniref:hypothetical protein n=1 Tax=Kaistella rhinocerotis TaxID=3026437 RepID=UPI0025544FAF|nr:hypothetical protein [Kaistella sp. Ran72]
MLKLSPELRKVVDDFEITDDAICFMTISKDNLDDMRSGIKNVEYRTDSDHWMKKFFIQDKVGNLSLKKNYTHLLFQNGYNPDSPRVLIELKGISNGRQSFPGNLSTVGHYIYTDFINLLLGKILYDSDPIQLRSSTKKGASNKSAPKTKSFSTVPKSKSKPVKNISASQSKIVSSTPTITWTITGSDQ